MQGKTPTVNNMKKNTSIKEKLTLYVGLLVAMIIGLVALSTISLQILTATEPNSPVADYGLNRALLLIGIFGAVCILIGLWMLFRLPTSINKPFMELSEAVNEVANHNYKVVLNLKGSVELQLLSQNFNRMTHRLQDYHGSSMSQLKTSKQYMETIINSIDEPIVCLGVDGTLLFINNAALSILNIKHDEAVGKMARDIAMHNDLLRKLINGIDEKHAKEDPLKIYADNRESYFQVKYLPVRMTVNGIVNQEQSGNVIMLQNITKFHQLDVAKTTFISTIFHELKTPVSAMLMSLQLLEDRRVGNLNTEQQELSQSIKDNGERLLSIIGELLNMTQVESGVMKLRPIITNPIDLIDYAIKANRMQAEKFNINVEIDYPKEKIAKLYVDSEKIAWVLTNLLSNGIRYSSEGGRVIIGARQPDSHHMEIFVQDFGKGIDPRYHESIFERYFRVPGTKIQGSGLGLSISRDFVGAHGGTLTLKSEVGYGSTFIVTLPV